MAKISDFKCTEAFRTRFLIRKWRSSNFSLILPSNGFYQAFIFATAITLKQENSWCTLEYCMRWHTLFWCKIAPSRESSKTEPSRSCSKSDAITVHLIFANCLRISLRVRGLIAKLVKIWLADRFLVIPLTSINSAVLSRFFTDLLALIILQPCWWLLPAHLWPANLAVNGYAVTFGASGWLGFKGPHISIYWMVAFTAAFNILGDYRGLNFLPAAMFNQRYLHRHVGKRTECLSVSMHLNCKFEEHFPRFRWDSCSSIPNVSFDTALFLDIRGPDRP